MSLGIMSETNETLDTRRLHTTVDTLDRYQYTWRTGTQLQSTQQDRNSRGESLVRPMATEPVDEGWGDMHFPRSMKS